MLMDMHGSPQSNPPPMADHRVGLQVPVRHQELNDYVDQENDLRAVQAFQLLWQASEETKLQRSEEDGVDRPQKYHILPHPIPPDTDSFLVMCL